MFTITFLEVSQKSLGVKTSMELLLCSNAMILFEMEIEISKSDKIILFMVYKVPLVACWQD